MYSRVQRWRWLAADLRAAKLSLVIVGLMVLVHAFLFYPFASDEVPQHSEWVYESLGLSYDGLMAGKVWQLPAHAFLHGNWWHLAINALGVLMLGSRLERMSGPATLLKVFIAGVLAGGLLQVLLSHDRLLVGASGGIAAILLWLTTVDPHARAWPIPVSAKNLGRGILLSEAGFTIAGLIVPDSAVMAVAHACHLGGGIVGWWLGKRQFGPTITREQLLRERALREAPREEEPIVPPDSPV
jgi:membrane associated rhomboid family serine protease